MSYESIPDHIQAVKNILVKCSRCGGDNIIEHGGDNIIEHTELESDESNSRGSMGQRTEYVFYAECQCRFCNNIIAYQERVSEYPQGNIEYIDSPRCTGGTLVIDTVFEVPQNDDEIYISDSRDHVRHQPKPFDSFGSRERLIVEICDGDAFIGDQIKDTEKIWVNPAGRLLPILVDEIGSIRFEDNAAVFAEIISCRPNVSAMKLYC